MNISLDMMNAIPMEIVDIISDYNDYEKYYKNDHKNGAYMNVLADFADMRYIFSDDANIRPSVASQCWGKRNQVNDPFIFYDMIEEDIDNDIADILPEWF